MNQTPHRLILIIVLSAFLSMLCAACIIIDDDDDDEEALERVNYHNNTNVHVDCYIDNNYVGRVDPFETLSITGYYEGRHLYFSEALENDWEWGPDYFTLRDGETLNISLDPPY